MPTCSGGLYLSPEKLLLSKQRVTIHYDNTCGHFMLISSPLVLVFITLVLLWVYGRILSRAASRLSKVQTIQNRMRALKKSSLELFPGLHVGGLDKYQLEDLKKFLRKNDALEMSLFLALYRPVFFEFEDLIANLRDQFAFLLGTTNEEAS